MRLLLRYFVQGCLVVAPILITLYVLYLVFTAIGRLVPVGLPIVGVFIVIAAVTAVGFLASGVVGNAVVRGIESWVGRVPLVKLLYNSIRDLIGAFVGDQKRFDKPVMVSLVPGSSVQAVGFLTREKVAFADDHVAVYFPQSYNFAGNVILCKRELVTPLDVNSADLMAFIVSGGVSPTRRAVSVEAGAERGRSS